MPALACSIAASRATFLRTGNKCGEVMGFAPYGRRDAIKPLLDFKDADRETDLSVPD